MYTKISRKNRIWHKDGLHKYTNRQHTTTTTTNKNPSWKKICVAQKEKYKKSAWKKKHTELWGVGKFGLRQREKEGEKEREKKVVYC